MKNFDTLATNISDFFRNKPRFNIVVLKGDIDTFEDFVKKLSFNLVDIQKEILDDKIKIHNVAGYTGLVEILKGLVPSHSNIFIKNVDILLTGLDRNKRRAFFEKLLSTTFNANLIVHISVFKNDVPDYEDYNHGLVIREG